VATASVVVTNVNARRSVQIGIVEDDSVVPAGNVTIPVDHDIPGIGDIVEVRYLYAFKESGSLFQSVYLGVRDDIELKDCTRDQLQFKREPELQAA
jgi:bifunctional non-homologous end joining protein LigD